MTRDNYREANSDKIYATYAVNNGRKVLAILTRVSSVNSNRFIFTELSSATRTLGSPVDDCSVPASAILKRINGDDCGIIGSDVYEFDDMKELCEFFLNRLGLT